MSNDNKFNLSKAVAAISGAMMTASTLAFAQTAMAQESEMLEEVVVTGIRASLESAIQEKRAADNVMEVIQSEDIGKLPDQNLAEVMENITGVQITRSAGVGTGVQIRGTNANRTEINGVSTVGSGAGRSGISFDDVSAAIISEVQVTKAPDAKTVEGSVGGTINLKTIRPLSLSEPLIAVRAQGEQSSLSDDGGWSPRLSGSFGNNWDTSAGEFGVVLSASYSEQDVSAFRPRADRDNLDTLPDGTNYLPIQFFVQDYDNFQYETTNLVGTFEWAPSDAFTFYFDAVMNEQERYQESTRVQASGVSTLIGTSIPDSYETVDFGSVDGENGTQNLGSIQAALTGVIDAQNDDRYDPNLRLSSDTGSRDTSSDIFSLGTDFNLGKFSGKVEIARSTNDTINPDFSTTLNFINPNTATGTANDNGTPIEYDLSGGSLAFGIADVANAPTTEQLLDPANYVLRDLNQSHDVVENTEDAFRIDVSYDLDASIFTTLDFGYRFNSSQSVNNDSANNTGLRDMAESPRGNLYADVLTAGPDNFNDADGRDLYVGDFLVINPALSNSDPSGVLDSINSAMNAIGQPPIDEPTSTTNSFFDITEETNALYAQANFQAGIFRGNFGLRYLETEVSSVGNRTTDGEVVQTETTGSYDFLLPRINIVADVTDEIMLRAAWSQDIRRPDFDALSTSFSFDTSPNPAAAIGNPGLEPEEVESWEISAEWYFAPSSMVSAGFFHKTRTGLFVGQQEDPAIDPDTGFRDMTAPCEGGGIFNPIADPNVFGPPGSPPGVCVPTSVTVNGDGETTQKGIELAFQYDLSGFEDTLGWASGFGIVTNYTWQEFEGGDSYYNATSRASTVFSALGNEDVTMRAQLLDNSENAYNFTVYYEKYGLSARARYTWRDAFRSEDFGSTSSYPWGFPVVQEARGQLNASVNYDVTDQFAVGIEGVNLTESDIEQSCVNEGALLCFQGLTDRRITLGASYKF
ncbi:TonB-dependent receptor [Gilvimarinus sp. DA14]|uniref:TonB-dependent receptor n=1 Tax=Gilvimarinus sp. DA14 TaxID=2956798 RepID=UPI0020B6F5A5|nr:TonB-dependent receptor [Gilvimarinus sp. DA14]UTF61033.1 TonB-dependent receptor [Gilvimarinus sp. DA14]